jgi:putative Mn2+ efflux pump MntP
MKRHPFDVISLVFGLIFLSIGIPLAVADSDFDLAAGRWIAPGLLVAIGMVVLVSTLPGRSTEGDGGDDDAASGGGPIR